MKRRACEKNHHQGGQGSPLPQCNFFQSALSTIISIEFYILY